MLNKFITGSISHNLAFKADHTALFLNKNHEGLMSTDNTTTTVSWACNQTHLDISVEGGIVHRWRYIDSNEHTLTLIDELNSTQPMIFTLIDMTPFQVAEAVNFVTAQKIKLENKKTRYAYQGTLVLFFLVITAALDQLLPFSKEMPVFMNGITGFILTYGFRDKVKHTLIDHFDRRFKDKE